LSDEEHAKVIPLKRVVVNHGGLAYHQYELELINDERLRSAPGVLQAHLVGSEIGKITWLEMRSAFTREYVEYVENTMSVIEPESGCWR
jgi:hypothetical protein